VWAPSTGFDPPRLFRWTEIAACPILVGCDYGHISRVGATIGNGIEDLFATVKEATM
jgi:hypothetical protein